MAAPREPLFLGRDSYRRRRLTDAARLLPLVGVILFTIPLLWGERDGEAPSTSSAGLYVFGVWIGLILAGYVLALRLSQTEPGSADPRDDADKSDPSETR
ncbi:MAG: hypothetical protein AAGK92_06820 [Pseudomonadota bacterium]